MFYVYYSYDKKKRVEDICIYLGDTPYISVHIQELLNTNKSYFLFIWFFYFLFF